MSRFPVVFRPPAFASWSSCSRRGVRPSSRSAYRTNGPDLDGVTAFRTHEQRPGWAPSIPRGQRCSPRTGEDAQPAPVASQRLVPKPRRQHSTDARLRLTRHQRGFKQFTRPVFPSPAAPGWNGSPSAFPPSFAPRRPGAGRRTSGAGTGHRARTRNNALRHRPSLQSSVFTRGVRPRVAPIIATVSLMISARARRAARVEAGMLRWWRTRRPEYPLPRQWCAIDLGSADMRRSKSGRERPARRGHSMVGAAVAVGGFDD